MMTEQGPRWQVAGLAVGFIVPVMLIIGTWFTMQADLRHLESRLSADEVSLTQDMSSLESRMRNVELDSASRLAAIETTLENIEVYLMEIKDYIKADLAVKDRAGR